MENFHISPLVDHIFIIDSWIKVYYPNTIQLYFKLHHIREKLKNNRITLRNYRENKKIIRTF